MTAFLSYVLFAAVIGGVFSLIAWLGDGAQTHKVYVRCPCGGCHATVTLIGLDSARNLATLLTETCPRCRQHPAPTSNLKPRSATTGGQTC